ncbi:MAG: hypothetical protein M1833_000140 [Piccolia ochrophora]|nr:MAG: hypothetical protein M1833_000140 [Piccolia ochrophora]
MAPRRAKQRLPSQQLQPSDYDSDFNSLSAMPAPPEPRSNAELNLSVLRRHNPAITSILSIAPYAVVYLFSPHAQHWEKSGIEGTLFVCQLTPDGRGAERYVTVVLNRRGLENFSADLKKGGDVEITEEYVILRDGSTESAQHVYGLWIFSEPPPSSTANTRVINAQIIQDCAVQAEVSQRAVTSVPEEQHTDREMEEAVEAEGELMGRQLSLQELFGKQREQNSAWSVKNHSPRISGRPFVPSADTDFFRSSARPSQQVKRPSNTMSGGGASMNGTHEHGSESNNLMEMFRKAGEKSRAGG